MNKEFLKGLGLEDEVIDKVFAENGKDVNAAKDEVNTLKTELENAKNKIGEYETEIGNLKDSLGDAEKLQKKIDDLEADINARKQADEAAATEKALKGRFDTVCGEAKFLNDFTRNGLFDEFKAALSDEKYTGKADTDIYKAITEGKENIFMPDGGIPGVVSSTSGGGSSATDADVRDIMGLPPIETK